MKPADFWKNFMLGEELSISGTFIYNGLRRFHEIRQLNNPDEVFEVFYALSVGIERLLKIAVVLIEHDIANDQDALEKSLITHNHLDLLHRIRQHRAITLGTPHHELLALLTTFYKSHRYDRFSLSSVFDLRKDRKVLYDFFAKHLHLEPLDPDSIIGTPNDPRYERFLSRTVRKISTGLFSVIESRARELNLYTYELRSGSRAETVFLSEATIESEDVLWKELLVFFMNTKTTSGYLNFLRGIQPLEFDPGLVDEYLHCFRSDAEKSLARDELDALYDELSNKGERLELMSVIGKDGICFESPEDDDATECE